MVKTEINSQAKDQLQRKKSEAEKKNEERFSDFNKYNPKTWRLVYITVVCAIPYLYVAYKSFVNGINYDLDMMNIIMQPMANCIFVIVLLFACCIAIVLSTFIEFISRENTFLLLFNPFLTVCFSRILLSLALSVLFFFNSCSDGFHGFYRFINPQFL